MCVLPEDEMGRTNIVLDDALVSRALKLTGLRSIREVVDYALRELIRHKRQQTLLELKGKVSWKGDLRRLRRKRAF
jgi:Arc/MetJ family transcription regulator